MKKVNRLELTISAAWWQSCVLQVVVRVIINSFNPER